MRTKEMRKCIRVNRDRRAETSLASFRKMPKKKATTKKFKIRGLYSADPRKEARASGTDVSGDVLWDIDAEGRTHLNKERCETGNGHKANRNFLRGQDDTDKRGSPQRGARSHRKHHEVDGDLEVATLTNGGIPLCLIEISRRNASSARVKVLCAL